MPAERPDVLEANLERLFARAYEPVRPAAEFRSRLRLALEREILRPKAARGAPAWRVAAAILLLLGGVLLGWAIFGRSEAPRGVEELHAGGTAELESDPPFVVPAGRDEFVADGTVLREPEIETSSGSAERASVEPVKEPEAPAAPSAVATLRGTPSLPEGGEMPESYEVTLLKSVRLPEVSQPFSERFAGADGFAFDDLEPGSWSVFVLVPGYAASVTRGVELAAGATVDLPCDLDAGTSLRGRVLDADGQPVEGALVLAEDDTPVQVLELALNEAPESWTAAARSDAQGDFELPHLPPGRKSTLRATRAGHGAGWTEADPAAVDPSDPRGGVEIRLTRAGAIEGRVAHDDGTAWPGAIVIVSLIDGAYRRCMSYAHAVAGAEGRYAVEDLPPGSYVVFNAIEAGGSGGPASPRIVQARVEAGERVRLDLPGTLQGTSVEGRLVSASGEPMPGLDLTIVPCGHGSEDWKAARSGDDGGFHFPDLAPGPYDVFVGRNLGAQFVRQARIEVPAVPTFRPTIEVASGSLHGQVASAATGKGLASSVVVLEIEAEGGRELHFAGRTQADADGRYEFLLVPPGRYRATGHATSGRFGQETIAEVDVPRADPLDFALQAGAALTIRVVDGSGRPVPDAAIEFTPATGVPVEFSPRDATDVNGVFRALGMKPGRWTIRASHESAGRAEVAIDLAAGEERTLEIELASDR